MNQGFSKCHFILAQPSSDEREPHDARQTTGKSSSTDRRIDIQPAEDEDGKLNFITMAGISKVATSV